MNASAHVVPAWVDEPVEEWPIAFKPASDGKPDRFILGADPKPLQTEMHAVVLMSPDWRATLTVGDLVNLAAGAYGAVAKKDCTRAEAETIARAWLMLAAPFPHLPTPGRRVQSSMVLH